MSDFDRQLINLIEDVTGGQVQVLRLLVDEYGAAPVARVFADGFGAVFSVPDSAGDHHDAVTRAILGCRFLSTDEALSAVQESPVSADLKIHRAPGAFDLRRGPAERQRRAFWQQREKTL